MRRCKNCRRFLDFRILFLFTVLLHTSTIQENMTSLEENEEMISDITFKITPQDFQNLCRTCLKMDKALQPISNSLILVKDGPVSVLHLLEFCLSVEVVETDSLPQNICIKCINMLLKIYHFRNQCNQNQNQLKFALENGMTDISSNKLASKCEIDGKLADSDVATEDESSSNEDEAAPAASSSDIGTLENRSSISSPGIDTKIELESESDDNDDTCEEITIKVESDDDTCEENKFADPDEINNAASESEDHGQSGPPKRNKSGKFKCKVCSVRFLNKEDLRKHSSQQKHSQVNKKYQMCEVCAKRVLSSGLKQHLRIHTNEKPYTCKECKAEFSIRANLRRHMLIHSGEKPHECEFCGAGFNRADYLKQHKSIIHSSKMNPDDRSSVEEVHICKLCGRECKTIEIYRRHVGRAHRENRKPNSSNTDDGSLYDCDVCEKHFKSKQLLRQHKISHREKSLLCTECGKSFQRKKSLDIHFRIHSGERPFKCKICSKDFISSSSYQSHMNIHTGVKRYTCKVCDKRFTQHSHLIYHLRIHSGEKPYSCSYCGKSFSVKGTLTVHLRIHTGDTPYLCPECGKGFYDTSSRRKHCKKTHNIHL